MGKLNEQNLGTLDAKGKGGKGGDSVRGMNRSESGSSLISSMAAKGNQIDQIKIEKLLTLFSGM